MASFRDGDAKRLDFLVDLNILTFYALLKILLSQEIFTELAKCYKNVMHRSCRKNWWASRWGPDLSLSLLMRVLPPCVNELAAAAHR